MVKKKIIKLSAIAAAGIAGLLLFLYATTEMTSQPSFCDNCHYMEPYVEGWKTSSHADVTCIKCHFPPGFKSKIKGKITAASMVVNYMTGIYKRSKPWAEISDESCLRSGCHVERLLDGKVMFKEGIIFDHKPHLSNLRRGKKLRCTSCHSQIVQGEHISVTESTCFLCHFKNQPEDTQINKCDWCHGIPELKDGKKDHSFVVENNIDCRKCHGEMQVGDGAVPEERCSQCHAELHHIEKYDDVDFIHTQHVTDNKVECQVCHSIIQHKSVAHTDKIFPECGTCHMSTHKAQLDLFRGVGGKNIPDHPNPMYTSGLNCEGCHVYHGVSSEIDGLGTNVKSSAHDCETCHGSGYDRILDQWQNVMNKKMATLEKFSKTVEAEVEKYQGQADKKYESEKLVNDALYNFNLVKKAKVVHNVAYSDELVAAANSNLSKAAGIIGSNVKSPDLSVYSKVVPSGCKNCHYGMEEVIVNVFGIDFPHSTHIIDQRLACSQCHSNVNKHGETVISRQECLSCHHTQEIVPCEQCHSVQANLYSGEIEFGDGESPDFMYDAEVSCRECHENDDAEIVKSNTDACIACHDDDYADMVSEWQENTYASVELIEARISKINLSVLTGNELKKINSIKADLELINLDNSGSAHNSELITVTLEKINLELSQIIN